MHMVGKHTNENVDNSSDEGSIGGSTTTTNDMK